MLAHRGAGGLENCRNLWFHIILTKFIWSESVTFSQDLSIMMASINQLWLVLVHMFLSS